MDDLREARHRAGLTQRELAALTGVAQPNIAAYETGRRRPSSPIEERLRRALRLRPSAVLREHRDEILRIARANKAVDVRVFGSIARGEDTPDSDIDLLVRYEPSASLFDEVGLVNELEALTGVHVDVVSEDTLHKPARRERIVREAVAL